MIPGILPNLFFLNSLYIKDDFESKCNSSLYKTLFPLLQSGVFKYMFFFLVSIVNHAYKFIDILSLISCFLPFGGRLPSVSSSRKAGLGSSFRAKALKLISQITTSNPGDSSFRFASFGMTSHFFNGRKKR